MYYYQVIIGQMSECVKGNCIFLISSWASTLLVSNLSATMAFTCTYFPLIFFNF